MSGGLPIARGLVLAIVVLLPGFGFVAGTTPSQDGTASAGERVALPPR
jgi:hypothetical protein